MSGLHSQNSEPAELARGLGDVFLDLRSNPHEALNIHSKSSHTNINGGSNT